MRHILRICPASPNLPPLLTHPRSRCQSVGSIQGKIQSDSLPYITRAPQVPVVPPPATPSPLLSISAYRRWSRVGFRRNRQFHSVRCPKRAHAWGGGLGRVEVAFETASSFPACLYISMPLLPSLEYVIPIFVYCPFESTCGALRHPSRRGGQH